MNGERNKMLPFVMIVITVILTVAAVGIGLTAAYLTDRDDEKNILTEGETIIEITETFPPAEDPDPGDAAVKVVRIENTGNLVCAVRCRLVFTDESLALITEPLKIGAHWVYGPEGFYYYLIPLEPGEATDPLIEEVVFRRFYDDGTPVSEQELRKLDAGLIVYSEALEFIRSGDGLPVEDEIIGSWEGY